MATDFPAFQQCLSHQKPEDQMSPIGLVCPECKRRLYLNPPMGGVQTFWESQPGAFTLDHEPCFVFQLRWNVWSIRSLHPSDSPCDLRSMAAHRFVAVDVPEELEEWPSSLEEFPEVENADENDDADDDETGEASNSDDYNPTD